MLHALPRGPAATALQHRANFADLFGHLAQVGIGVAGRFFEQALLALHHVAHPNHQLVRVKRLGDVVVHPGAEAGDAIGGHALGGEEDHRGSAETFVFAQQLEQPEAIHPRHHHVAQHHIRQLALGLLPALFAIGGSADDEAFILEVGLHRCAQAGLVVHQQHPRRGIQQFFGVVLLLRAIHGQRSHAAPGLYRGRPGKTC